MNALANVKTITKRELGAYFSAPLAYIFIVIFLLLCGFFTFFVGGFFNIGQASLGFSKKPADKLSPSTRIRFTREESCRAAGADWALANANDATPTAARVPHCFPDLCIYFAGLTLAGKT